MNRNANITLRTLLQENSNYAQVLDKHQFASCKIAADDTLETIAVSQNIELSALLLDLEQESNQSPHSYAVLKEWNVVMLMNHIENKHHRYTERMISTIRSHFDILVQQHSSAYPELVPIKDNFLVVSGALAMHMKREELVLFPWIRKMMLAKEQDIPVAAPRFGTANTPIAQLTHDHQTETEDFENLAKWTNRYTPPKNGCVRHSMVYAMLASLQKDLERHMFLEDNILFPKALALEKKLMA